MEASNLSGVNAIGWEIQVLRELVLSNTNILAGTFDAKELADGGPKFVLPCNKIVLNAVKIKR